MFKDGTVPWDPNLEFVIPDVSINYKQPKSRVGDYPVNMNTMKKDSSDAVDIPVPVVRYNVSQFNYIQSTYMLNMRSCVDYVWKKRLSFVNTDSDLGKVFDKYDTDSLEKSIGEMEKYFGSNLGGVEYYCDQSFGRSQTCQHNVPVLREYKIFEWWKESFEESETVTRSGNTG